MALTQRNNMSITTPQQGGIDSLDRFLEHCHRRHYPAKSVIIYAGDKPDVLYYIIDGSVSVLIEDEDGHERLEFNGNSYVECWLAFVSHELWNLKWDGNEWI